MYDYDKLLKEINNYIKALSSISYSDDQHKFENNKMFYKCQEEKWKELELDPDWIMRHEIVALHEELTELILKKISKDNRNATITIIYDLKW